MLSTFVDTIARKDVCLCVHATRVVRAVVHIAVKLLLVAAVASSAGLRSQRRWDASEASLWPRILWKCLLCFAVLILMILTRSCCASCWMKRCLSSMCFAFLEDLIRVAMLFPLEESVWIRMFTFFMLSASWSMFLMWRDSVAAVLMA